MDIIQKVAPSKLFFSITQCLTMAEMSSVVPAIVPKLYEEARRLNLTQIGTLEFLYDGCDGQIETVFDLTIALPIAQKNGQSNRANYLEMPAFACLSTHYHGGMEGIKTAWDTLIQTGMQQNLPLTQHGRELYHHWVAPNSPENITELQLGI